MRKGVSDMDYALEEKLSRLEEKLDDKVGGGWMSTADAVKYVGVHRKTIHRAIRRGDLRVSQKLGKNLFKREWLDRWLNG
jgi:excisionase family DNA binding protein|tara:strand:+ start:476 stop:715 length:240 start_codon:yes stop_codon:yes gene_type:complete